MGLQADAAFRGRQTEVSTHGPAEPGPWVGFGGPGAFVEPTEDHQINRQKARLQGPEDGEARVAAKSGPNADLGQQTPQERRIARRGHRHLTGGSGKQVGGKVGRLLAGLLGPKAFGTTFFRSRRQGFRQAQVRRQEIGQGCLLRLEDGPQRRG